MPERRKPMDMSKVMDVTHPARVQPSTTSRPVIVSNRPMIPEDPMINQAALSAIDVEKPAGAPTQETAPEVPSAPDDVSAHHGKTVMPVVGSSVEEAPKAKETVEVAEDQALPGVAITIDSDTETDIAGGQEAEAPKPSDEAEVPPEKEPPAPKAAEPKPKAEASLHSGSSKSDEVGSFAAIPDGTQLDEGDPESKEKTAEDKRRDEIEELIAAGTYHVPIGQVAKRRSRTVFTVIIILLLLLALFDLVLDMGLLTLPGVPHTTFLQ